MTTHLRAALAGGIAVMSVALLAAAAPGAEAAEQSYLSGLITPAPAVHVTVTGLTSEAQLMQQLGSQGYSDIKLSPEYPNSFDPHPELLHGVTSPADPAAQITPVHIGWNGTAVKNGQTANIYVDRVLLPR